MHDFNYKMSTAFVTGGSGFIGRAIAAKLKKHGYNVVIGYFLNKERAIKFAEELNCKAVYIDVSDTASVVNAFKKAREFYGRISLLINCAGIALKQKVITDVSESEFDELYKVNVRGAFNCVKEVIPDMLYSGGGDIINVSSIWGVYGASCEVAYSATKGAINAFTLALSQELSPSRIKVNAVAPGFVDSPMNAHLSQEDKALFLKENRLESLTTAEQVAENIIKVLNSSVTGRIIKIENKKAKTRV